MISVVLLVVWAMTGADYFWPIWPILGFLIAIGWQVFAVSGPGAVDDDRRPRQPLSHRRGPRVQCRGPDGSFPLGRSFFL